MCVACCLCGQYVGAATFSNGQVALFRWQRRNWVLADLGRFNDNFDPSNWLYLCPTDPDCPDQPPTRGWRVANRGHSPPPRVTLIDELLRELDAVGDAQPEVDDGHTAEDSSANPLAYPLPLPTVIVAPEVVVEGVALAAGGAGASSGEMPPDRQIALGQIVGST
jgi:hypothetical protein